MRLRLPRKRRSALKWGSMSRWSRCTRAGGDTATDVPLPLPLPLSSPPLPLPLPLPLSPLPRATSPSLMWTLCARRNQRTSGHWPGSHTTPTPTRRPLSSPLHHHHPPLPPPSPLRLICFTITQRQSHVWRISLSTPFFFPI